MKGGFPVADLHTLGARQAVEAIRTGKITSEALTAACLARIAEREPQVRAFVDLQPERALARARSLDQHGPGDDTPLHGLPVAVKEIFDVSGYRCGWGTPIHADRVPDQHALSVARLEAAGAVILGTTVSTEYAIAAAGPTRNPHDLVRTPGGSSSGSAAAVADCMAPLALGSQSIGSIVRPATYCGVFGIKPGLGAIDTGGVMPLAVELDHVGVLARSVEDIELACAVLFTDVQARATAPAPPAMLSHVVHLIGPLRSRVQPASQKAEQRALDRLKDAGVAVSRVELDRDFDAIKWIIDVLLCRGFATHHGDDYEQHAGEMSSRVRGLVERGRTISDTEHERALTAAGNLAQRLAALLPPGTVALNAAVDDIAPPFTDGTGGPILQGLWTLTGLPALATPCGRIGRMPIGVQLGASAGQEASLFAAARLIFEEEVEQG